MEAKNSKIGLIKYFLAINSLCVDRFQNSFAHLLPKTRGCATCINQVHRSKVKVTDRGQRSKIGLIEQVWATNSLCIDRFQNNSTQLITRIRRCITCINRIHRVKVKVTDRGQRSKVGLIKNIWATNSLCVDRF